MKKYLIALLVFASAALAGAEPARIALMDFEDQTGVKSDSLLNAKIDTTAFAAKGMYLLGKDLANQGEYTLIDRRDFISQIEKLQPTDAGMSKPTKPSFLHAAQALRADVVLRGQLVSFSTGKQIVNQGGYETEFATLSLRVSLEALDAVDGSVIAIADGSASGNYRQTKENFSVISEDDALTLYEKAIAEALPSITAALDGRMAKQQERAKIKLSIKTSADPAMIEIDGILVGTSPVENMEVYQGDHVLTIGKAGYRDITKRILFEKNTEIEVPMMRIELSAEETKDVLEKIRLNVIETEPGLIIRTVD